MEWILFIWTGLAGIAIGSFLNVVIYRVPRQIPFATGRSVCPECDNQLRWYHNIPLLSFAFLRGKCGFCKTKISYRYPLVELINGLLYLFFFWQAGMTWEFAAYSFLGSALLAIFLIDLDFQIIPDVITYPGMVLGLLYAFTPGGMGILSAAIGLLVGGGALYAVAMLGDFLFKKESMGGGDIKMAAMLGAFLGWQKVLLIFMLSAVIGLIVSLALMVVSEELRKTRVIPFGPFIATAALVAIVYGRQIIDFYVQNFLQIN
jgi:leader peptidase (prepilin peptidase)/N-methyltransferase